MLDAFLESARFLRTVRGTLGGSRHGSFSTTAAALCSLLAWGLLAAPDISAAPCPVTGSNDGDGTGCVYTFTDPDPADGVRHPNIDPDASIVYVRADCGERPNCFESMRMLSDFSDGWLWVGAERGGRSDPKRNVVVDIGPGTFGSFACPARRLSQGLLQSFSPFCEEEDPGEDPSCEDILIAQSTAERAGHVSLRGAGRGITVLTNVVEQHTRKFEDPTDPACQSDLVECDLFGTLGEKEGSDTTGFRGQDCEGISARDMTFRGSSYGVVWNGGGRSVWTDVDQESSQIAAGAASTGWAGSCHQQAQEGYFWHLGFSQGTRGDPLIPAYTSVGDTPGAKPIHFYHGVRFLGFGGAALGGQPASAFYDACGENWLYGGEATLHLTDAARDPGLAGAVAVWLPLSDNSANGDFRAFGTKISVVVDIPMTPSAPVIGVSVQERVDQVQDGNPRRRSQFHLHGGIIEVRNLDASNDGDVIGIRVDGCDGCDPERSTPEGEPIPAHTAFAHTVESVFAFENQGSGRTVRLEASDGGVALAPFLWPPSKNPPEIDASLAGQDLYVETDCQEGGDCTGEGDQSHLHVYDPSCSGNGPWRSGLTGSCR